MAETAKSILVADDEPLFREITVDAIRAAGFRTTEASDGQEAIDELQRFKPDLVLLDINMPKVSGWGVLEHIAKLSIRPRVVLMSGFDEVVPPGHLAPHVHAVMNKPFRARSLSRRLPPCSPSRSSRQRVALVAKSDVLSRWTQWSPRPAVLRGGDGSCRSVPMGSEPRAS